MPQAGTLLQLADVRRLRRGGAASTAEEASPPEGSSAPEATGTGTAEILGVKGAAVGSVRAAEVQLHNSVSAVALGQNITVERGGGGVLAGARLNVSQGGGQWLIGGLVQARQVFAVTVVAGKIEGDVRCLFDARGAFAFGAALALVGGALRLLLRRH